jgi:hypothetical protein
VRITAMRLVGMLRIAPKANSRAGIVLQAKVEEKFQMTEANL